MRVAGVSGFLFYKELSSFHSIIVRLREKCKAGLLCEKQEIIDLTQLHVFSEIPHTNLIAFAKDPEG